jgi:hypothetical protein
MVSVFVAKALRFLEMTVMYMTLLLKGSVIVALPHILVHLMELLVLVLALILVLHVDYHQRGLLNVTSSGMVLIGILLKQFQTIAQRLAVNLILLVHIMGR